MYLTGQSLKISPFISYRDIGIRSLYPHLMSFMVQYLGYEYYIYAYGIYTIFSPLPYGIFGTMHTVLLYLGAGSTENQRYRSVDIQ